jgi:outer membrane biosynthesis protein TonB
MQYRLFAVLIVVCVALEIVGCAHVPNRTDREEVLMPMQTGSRIQRPILVSPTIVTKKSKKKEKEEEPEKKKEKSKRPTPTPAPKPETTPKPEATPKPVEEATPEPERFR